MHLLQLSVKNVIQIERSLFLFYTFVLMVNNDQLKELKELITKLHTYLSIDDKKREIHEN